MATIAGSSKGVERLIADRGFISMLLKRYEPISEPRMRRLGKSQAAAWGQAQQPEVRSGPGAI
jgi:hypothetical protein